MDKPSHSLLQFHSVTLIIAPYHSGIPGVAVANGPSFLQDRGIKNVIENLCVEVLEVLVSPVYETYEGDIARSFEVFRRISKAVREAHQQESFPIVLAGNCGSGVGAAAGSSELLARLGRRLSCVWFDAHDDFNTPDTLASGYFDSMPIAMLGGLCFKTLLDTVEGHSPLDLERQLIHVGMRDVNELERQHVESAKLSVVWGSVDERIDFASGLKGFLREKNFVSQPIQVHFDVDSMDTSIGKANRFAAPGGLYEEDVLQCFTQIAEAAYPISFTIASFDPSFNGAENIADAAIKGTVHLVKAMQAKKMLVSKDVVP